LDTDGVAQRKRAGAAAAAAEPDPSAASREPAEPAPAGGDTVSREWLERLRDGAPDRETAVEELHALLVNAARFTLAKRCGRLPQLRREPLGDLAVEAADDALVAILAHLDDFRGESRFTTWAWKFAFLQTSVTLRRRNWMAREIPLEEEGWASLSREASPQRRAEEGELLAGLKRAVEEELTPHQRMVFVALALNGVPVDVLAERMGTTRGALYKTLHDARHKLRAYLASSGLGPDPDAPAQKRHARRRTASPR
jgi:RNA polymerase sigma-70 factor (ECF subfamily)